MTVAFISTRLKVAKGRIPRYRYSAALWKEFMPINNQVILMGLFQNHGQKLQKVMIVHRQGSLQILLLMIA